MYHNNCASLSNCAVSDCDRRFKHTLKIRFTFMLGTLAFLQAFTHSVADGTLDVAKLKDYANQPVPSYITKDNTGDNPITDEAATLGRVLFYDKHLSTSLALSCASCHQQERAFSDSAEKSQGVAGLTDRHSPRLINTRFASETRFFWDERATTLEDQASEPIKDHIEMGYSGIDGSPNIDDLIVVLDGLDYYPPLFNLAFGDPEITEERMQLALAQFVRSIQSFDSKYDAGRAQVDDHMEEFPNFSAEENAGKRLFTDDFEYEVGDVEIERFSGTETFTVSRRISGGLNCAACHRPPEFDIDPASLSNGFDRGVGRERDFSVTRSPTLRDLTNPSGELNSPMFHGGTANDIVGIKAHYNFREFDALNTNLDPRMIPGGFPQFLDMTANEQEQLFAFLRTLSGSDVYTNKKWSDPFDASGNMTLTNELRINTIQYSSEADSITLELSTVPGASYTLWTSSNLSSNEWSIVQPNIPSHPMEFKTVSGPFMAPDSPQAFFRFSEEAP